MENYFIRLWRTKWFKVFVAVIFTALVTGVVLQFLIGLNPNDDSTLVTYQDQTTLNADSIYVYNANLNESTNGVGIFSNVTVEYFIFNSIVSSTLNETTLDALASEAIYHNTSVDQNSIWTDLDSEMAIVIKTPQNSSTQFAMVIREFSDQEMTKVGQYQIGNYIITFSVWAVIIFFILLLVIPLFKKKPKSANPMSLDRIH